MNNKTYWGVIGMGVMGTNLSRNFAKQGIQIALYNRFVRGSEENIALKKSKKYLELNSALTFESLDLLSARSSSNLKLSFEIQTNFFSLYVVKCCITYSSIGSTNNVLSRI